MNVFRNQTIEIACPECNTEFEVTFKQVIEGDTVKCISCENDIELQDSNGELAKADKAYTGFIKKFE